MFRDYLLKVKFREGGIVNSHIMWAKVMRRGSTIMSDKHENTFHWICPSSMIAPPGWLASSVCAKLQVQFWTAWLQGESPLVSNKRFSGFDAINNTKVWLVLNVTVSSVFRYHSYAELPPLECTSFSTGVIEHAETKNATLSDVVRSWNGQVAFATMPG